MFYFIWLAIIPTACLAMVIAAAVVVTERQRYPAAPARDSRPLLQQWEDGALAGSVDLASELRHRAAVEDRPTLAWAAQVLTESRLHRMAALFLAPSAAAPPRGMTCYLDGKPSDFQPPRQLATIAAAVAVTICPVCEARDDQPHDAETCPFYEPPFIP